MKKKLIISTLVIISTIAVGKILTLPNEQSVSAQEVSHAYAKWGRLAMEKVKEKYPEAKIIDYLHLGREEGNQTSIEKFKLWLKAKDGREFGVFVNITFNKQTEEVVEIQLEESDQ